MNDCPNCAELQRRLSEETIRREQLQHALAYAVGYLAAAGFNDAIAETMKIGGQDALV